MIATVKFIKEDIPFLENGESFKKDQVRSVGGWRVKYWIKKGYCKIVEK